jgi:fatty-acyl-CoA synthase
MSQNIYDIGLDRNAANYVALSPLSLIERAAKVYPDRAALVHGKTSISWSECYARCRRLANALTSKGIGKGDTVSIMASNIPAMFEAHFGVPMSGAVLNALNFRLDANTIAQIFDHAETKVLITDRQFSTTIKAALAKCHKKPFVIDIDDMFSDGEMLGKIEYEAFLKTGDPNFSWSLPHDEWDAISLNYTSGTTGDPKGVVYHHRGAYLLAMGNIVVWNLPSHPIYLWTLPMFHCNGWCFPWTMAGVAGTNICLRNIDAASIYTAIADHNVTHFCGAPIVLNMMINADQSVRTRFDHTVEVMTAAAPPPAAVLETMEAEGFHVTHVYGLTEVYGPAVVCAWHDKWDALPSGERAILKARQGVPYHVLEGAAVVDSDTFVSVPTDGQTIGEIILRGNVVMKGYLKNQQATNNAFAGGWFHTGDLGVMHPDGYIELKDRSKDIIISGGENISTVEVEAVLYRHPDVLEVAVVAKPNDHWGEVPCAFVTLKNRGKADMDELIAFCRDNLAHYKCPKSVVFGPLPKTSTGKVQKFILREHAART